MAILLATEAVSKLFFDSAGDLAKQLITVATGILGLSITFLKDVVKDAAKNGLWLLRWCWIVYLASVVCGFWTLMAITGSIATLLKDPGSVPPTDNIRLPAGLQIIAFGIATVLLVAYGMIALRKFKTQPGTDISGD